MRITDLMIRNDYLAKKLTEAKEIIKKFLNAKSIEETCVIESEAEKFIKDLEK